MSNAIKQRNYTLDVIKAISAFMIVFIHSQFPSDFGQVVSSVAQFGVPVFFMISGYYIYNANSTKIIKSIKHILFLITVAYILNLIRIFIKGNFDFMSLFTPKHIVQFLILNISSISGVLWFILHLYIAMLFIFLQINSVA